MRSTTILQVVLATLSSAMALSTAFVSAPYRLELRSTRSALQVASETEAATEPDVAAVAEIVKPTFRSAQELSSLTSSVKTLTKTEDIDAILPHRYPFAMVDKVVEYEPGKRAVGIKAVTKNEEFFQGHFPSRPVMPGVMQVEALAQLAGLVALQSEGADPGCLFLFAGVDGVKWKKPVVPGDLLVMEVEITKWNAKFGLAKATGKAYVDGQLAVEVGSMTFAIVKD